MREFDVVAEDGVVSNLEVRNPGFFHESRLILRKPDIRVALQQALLIKRRVHAILEDSAFARGHRRSIDEHLLQFLSVRNERSSKRGGFACIRQQRIVTAHDVAERVCLHE